MIKQLRQIVTEAGRLLVRGSLHDFQIRTKSERDFVTTKDEQVSTFLISRLRGLVPDATFLCEDSEFESTARRAPKVWVIDPIDGTTNFIHSYPFFTISVALCDVISGRCVASLVLCPRLKQLFEAYENEPSTLNGKVIQVSQEADLSKSLVLGGFSHGVGTGSDEIDAFVTMSCETHGTRRSGCASLDICYVAAGFADAYFHFNLKPWDTMGAAHILENAGGCASNIGRELYDPHQKTIIASNGKFHLQINRLLETILHQRSIIANVRRPAVSATARP